MKNDERYDEGMEMYKKFLELKKRGYSDECANAVLFSNEFGEHHD